MAKLGVIADDFTGAGDMGSFLAAGGMRTVLITEFRSNDKAPEMMIDADAIIIALKSRTEPVKKAVKDAIDALHWLQGQGCGHFYFKYCSTFDSTPKGNIGPVSDALMEALNTRQSILCPALPVNGRIVHDGKLYVNGVLLENSPMRNHPLTPMRQSDIVSLMTSQSKYPSRKIGRVYDKWKSMPKGVHREYLIPDCENEQDLVEIAHHFFTLPLLTGGSGLAYPLAKIFSAHQSAKKQENASWSKIPGNALLLAGSCSAQTLKQIQTYQKDGGVALAIPVNKMISGIFDFDEFVENIISNLQRKDVLIYSSNQPNEIEIFKHLDKDISEKIERVMGMIAQSALMHGCKKIIVAGGETSGAVTKALGVKSVHIGPSVAPGVPVMQDTASQLRLVLKSGNFGQDDFFEQAINAL